MVECAAPVKSASHFTGQTPLQRSASCTGQTATREKPFRWRHLGGAAFDTVDAVRWASLVPPAVCNSMKRKGAKSNRWSDHYTRRAKQEKYPARSVYKLQEIQQKYRILRKGDRVLDLGCAPGSWLIYAARCVGSGGRVIGIDLKPVSANLPDTAAVVRADVLRPDSSELEAVLRRRFDVVLSDMAPATTGQKDTDAARSLRLCEAALEIASRVLDPGGRLLVKIFQGPDFEMFRDAMTAAFDQCRLYKPQSSRKASKEIYLIGIGKS